MEDEVERARRGVIRFLDERDSRPDPGWRDLKARIDRVREQGDISLPDAEAMQCIRRMRNARVYRRAELDDGLRDFARACQHLQAEAGRRGLSIGELDTDWRDVVGPL